MKRVFLFISNLLLTFFLIATLSFWKEALPQRLFPGVAVHSGQADYTTLKQELDSLARKHNSLIARTIWEVDSDGKSRTLYEAFGDGQLPDWMPPASQESIHKSDLLNNYNIISGSLTSQELATHLKELGLEKANAFENDRVSFVLAIFTQPDQLISMLIFLLTFLALIVISQIQSLSQSGIRLISGERLSYLFFRSLARDGLDILLFGLPALLIACILLISLGYPYEVQTFLGILFILYNSLLLLLSLLIAFLFTISLKKVHLLSIIKGKLPIKSILRILYFGQVLAILLVIVGFGRMSTYYHILEKNEAGQATWEQRSNVVTLKTGRSSQMKNLDELQTNADKWFDFIQHAIDNENAFLIKHNLVEQALKQATSNHNETENNPYGVEGKNILYVTPSYFQKEDMDLSSETFQKINTLKDGQILAILPEELQKNEKDIKSTLQQELTNRLYSSKSNQTVEVSIAYTNQKNDVFLYNTAHIAYDQWLSNPIFLVLSPKALGKASSIFWFTNLEYLYFTDLHQTQELLKHYQLDHMVSRLSPARETYLQLNQKIKIEIFSNLASAMFAILTSILLFTSLNLLYFEAFRKTIFLKKIAGYYFFELHSRYITSQIAALFLGSGLAFIISKNIWITLILFFSFSSLAVLLLKICDKEESKTYVSIIKGG
jgi:bacteriocin-associated integral membrane protein